MRTVLGRFLMNFRWFPTERDLIEGVDLLQMVSQPLDRLALARYAERYQEILI